MGKRYKQLGLEDRDRTMEMMAEGSNITQIAKALGIHVSEIFPRKGNISSQFSHQDIQIIKKALKLLNKSLAKLVL